MKKQSPVPKGDDNMIKVTLPSNKPFIISKEEADKIFENQEKTPLTPEKYDKIKENAEQWFKKPDKKD